jgi:hypothetical protein
LVADTNPVETALVENPEPVKKKITIDLIPKKSRSLKKISLVIM